MTFLYRGDLLAFDADVSFNIVLQSFQLGDHCLIYENCARFINQYEIPWRHRLCAGKLPSRTGAEQRNSGSLHICLKFFILLNFLYKRLWTCRHGWLSKLIEARIATVGGWTSTHTQYGPRSVHSSTAHSQESMFFLEDMTMTFTNKRQKTTENKQNRNWQHSWSQMDGMKLSTILKLQGPWQK